MVKVLDSTNFDSAINTGVTIVDFYADWCGPCKMMGPVMENISDEVENVSVCKVNVDKANDIAAKYNVMSIPTFIIFKDGNQVETFKGAMPKEMITSKLNKFINQ
ncbi:MAG TPA: thioredoxin [Clostridiales bacterium]|nr:MAG: thioredoxin [Clostridiales bacterium GWD2_32_19]HCC06869.1 thioredoxin [Clostridiales bacterium]